MSDAVTDTTSQDIVLSHVSKFYGEVLGINKSVVVPMNKAMRFEAAETTNASAAAQNSGGGKPQKNIAFWIVIAGIAASIVVMATDDDDPCRPALSPATTCP